MPSLRRDLYLACSDAHANKCVCLLFSAHFYIFPSIYIWLYIPLLDLGRFFSFQILYTVGRTSWTGDQPVARPLPTHRTTQSQSKRTQTSMSWVGLEPTILVFERAKRVHALDGSETKRFKDTLCSKVGATGKIYINIYNPTNSLSHTVQPWSWRRNISPKLWYPPSSLCGIIAQQELWKFTTVKP
jgi:hypothetical protein